MLRMALPAAAIAALAIAAPAAANEDYSYIAKGTRCVSHDGGQTVAARTRWRFNFGTFVNTSIQRVRLHARLVPTTSGHNLFRSWRKVEAPLTAQQKLFGGWRILGVTTDTVSGLADWKLQVKLTWDRYRRRDWHRTLSVAFNADACGPLVPAPAIALPMSGGA